MVLQLHLELLESEVHLTPGVQDAIDKMRGGIRRIAETSRNLLSFAKEPPMGEESELCQVRDVVPRLIETVRRVVPENIAIEVGLDESADAVSLASPALEQALLNLILNARDAMKGGGTLSVRVQHDPSAKLDVITVADTGGGMPPEVAERAFEPFYTTKEELGTGLGLAMVWGTVTGAGGTVELDTAPGGGTTFTLRLPTRPRAGVPGASDSEEADVGADLAGVRVLVVEDDRSVADGIQATLDRLGAVPRMATSVAEAQQQLREDTEVDLLITDSVLPGGGTGEFLVGFRDSHPGAAVLLCSGYVDEPWPIDVLREPACAFLRKPFGSADLARTARRLLEQSRRPVDA
jgi:CheY-like chemotaxis protein